jgi:hypothetical protein
MNKKLTKLRETSGHNKDRHPSQNDLPPIDKFHPDWWYYRQEMDEPDDEIDNIYKNESRNMNKKLIRLTESDLHKIVKESVEKILSESDYDNFFDWADNSSASPEEIEAASQRHDSRIPSIKSPTDKLARRERVFNRRASMNDPDIGERIANRKDFIKNQKQGERFRNRITK